MATAIRNGVVSEVEAADLYQRHRTYVLAVLSRRCAWLAGDEREEILHEAYAVTLQKGRDGSLDLTGMSTAQVRAYLTQTAIHKALDEGKRVGRNRSVPLEDVELTAADGMRPPEELVAATIDSARVREIVGELPERRQAIIKLRFFFERSPGEIQSYLGISERVYRRELERSLRQLIDSFRTVEDGSFCEGRRSTILAYVAGIAGPARMQAARAHLETCPACTRTVVELREVARRAAVILPMPPFVVGARGGTVSALLDSARDTFSHAATTLKQQFFGAATRVDAGSAGYAAAARPGTVTAVLLSCVAIGGGGAYCAVNGLPPLIAGGGGAKVQAVAPQTHKPPAPSRQAVPPPTTVQEVVEEPPVATPVTPDAAPDPHRKAVTQAREEAQERKAEAKAERKRESSQVAAEEFGFEESSEAPTEASSEADVPVATASSSTETASAPTSSASSSSSPASHSAAGGSAEFEP